VTTLGALLADAGVEASLPADARAIEVSTVELDSRQCGPGSVFVCMQGTMTTGEAFVGDAIARGAVCVVASAPVPAAKVSVTVPSSSLRSVLAALSSAVVGRPAASLTLAAVTGTNGKTTVTWLLNGILSHAGYTAATIGTLSGGRTTPSAPDLHRQLRTVADRAELEGRKGAVALEVSSHALDQGRVDGIRFDVAVFTNLSHEHLDYHGTMERYFEAKARLFEPPKAKAAVICVDDEWGRKLVGEVEVPVVEVSSEDATVLDARVGGTTLRWRSETITTHLTGRLNVTNTILAVAAADTLGVATHDAAAALEALAPVPGRLEVIGDGTPSVLVDYAHTPHALERVLLDLRELRTSSRLICVFGCGGDRDVAKRPQMGAIASLLADDVVVTLDNPRGEDPDAIIDQILTGAKGPARLRREPDRARAIALAIESARDDDVVLIAGKGHETTQEVAGELLAFDDREVAATALRAKGAPC
jgi:UDP-N-acetylmuramoyl-L-alanyl-D-glutamate--2,6-diaminopimelate ligase